MSNCVQSRNAVFVLIFFKTMYYKTILLDKFFVISGLVKVSQGKCYQPWPLVQLITLTGIPTVFTPDITKLFLISFQRPVLVILDRNMDLCTPLHHTWTYQALVHDVLVREGLLLIQSWFTCILTCTCSLIILFAIFKCFCLCWKHENHSSLFVGFTPEQSCCKRINSK